MCWRAERALSCGLRKSFWNALFAVAKINKTSLASLSGFGDISADAKRPGELVAPAKVLPRRTRPAEVRRSDMLRHALCVPLVEVLGRLVRGAAASGAAAGVVSILGEKALQPLGFAKRSGCGAPPERPRLGPDGPVDPHKSPTIGHGCAVPRRTTLSKLVQEFLFREGRPRHRLRPYRLESESRTRKSGAPAPSTQPVRPDSSPAMSESLCRRSLIATRPRVAPYAASSLG
jgi:hypothetical protein